MFDRDWIFLASTLCFFIMGAKHPQGKEFLSGSPLGANCVHQPTLRTLTSPTKPTSIDWTKQLYIFWFH